MTAQPLTRFAAFDPPSRSAVDHILSSADRAAAEHQAIEEIREVIASYGKKNPLMPVRRIRTILKEHGLWTPPTQ